MNGEKGVEILRRIYLQVRVSGVVNEQRRTSGTRVTAIISTIFLTLKTIHAQKENSASHSL